MKKIALSFLLAFATFQGVQACIWYEPDLEYFNLFTQSIIKNKSYTPFLLTYSNYYYEKAAGANDDENILSWQAYFDNKTDYQQTEEIVYRMPLEELEKMRNGRAGNALLRQLGSDFYGKYSEGIDYLITAKSFEPFMRVYSVANSDFDYYYYEKEENHNVSELDCGSNIALFRNMYDAVTDPQIKIRYAYQLVRFQHYKRLYEDAIADFENYVEPLNLKNAVYYMALDQLAGAQRGAGEIEDANWNFFQVFLHSNRQKVSAYSSMKLTNQDVFDDLLNRARTDDEKCAAYFLLGYQDFNNPLPMMEKIYQINPNSELLQVLAARAINELERAYLPVGYYDENREEPAMDPASLEKAESVKQGFFAKIWNFIKKLFTSSKKSKNTYKNSIPYYSGWKKNNYLKELDQFIRKVQEQDKESFWTIAEAYTKFLDKKHDESLEILSSIENDSEEYREQIERMKILNDIVRHQTIDESVEKMLFEQYKSFFVAAEPDDEVNYYNAPTTEAFLKDVIANRYFLQGDAAKSFLMSNPLESFRKYPERGLAESLEKFHKKKNKNSFEQEILYPKMEGVGNLDAYFAVVFGDFAMRKGDFKEANKRYQNAAQFKGYPNYDYMGNSLDEDSFDGYRNISSLVFGHNIRYHLILSAEEALEHEEFIGEFPFIQPVMNKYDISQALLELKKIAESSDARSAKAYHLIGNLLYNTTSTSYYRHLFVMDLDNTNDGKYEYREKPYSNYTVYYKNYNGHVFVEPDNYDLALGYLEKAFEKAKDDEHKAKILFQMGSAEQGKFYQWTQNDAHFAHNGISSDGENYKEVWNNHYRTYFHKLVNEFGETDAMSDLARNCDYLSNYYFGY